MPQTELFLIFTERLETAATPYMVSGSVASIIYGEPRLTNDIDIILSLVKSDAGLGFSILLVFVEIPREIVQ